MTAPDRAASVASLVRTAGVYQAPAPLSCARCGSPDLWTPEHGQFTVCRRCKLTHMHRSAS
jgi:hypothetical protein